MNFSFFMPAQLLVGDNIVEENSALLAGLGTRCLLVTGKSSAKKSGALDDVTAALDSHGIPWQVFDGVGQNPPATPPGPLPGNLEQIFLLASAEALPWTPPRGRLSMPPIRSLPAGISTTATKIPPSPSPWWAPPPAQAAR